MVAEHVSKDVGYYVGYCQIIKEVVESNSELLSFFSFRAEEFSGAAVLPPFPFCGLQRRRHSFLSILIRSDAPPL